MADRFPSLEDIDAGQTEARGEAANFDLVGDSAADGSSFLDRERAALGDDAARFASAGDNAATVQDADEDDLLGGGGNYAQADGAGLDDMGSFESSFPAIDTQNERMAPGGTITGSSILPGAPAATSSYQPTFSDEPEPEVIRQWRETRDAQIQRRDEASQARKDETIGKAREDIDAFYESYNDKKEKAIKTTQKEAEDFLSNREDTAAGGTSWERIAKLVDLTGKGGRGGGAGSGKERFREMLVSLRKDEKAPGATGY